MVNWKNCHNILCIRPDNMGDLLMSGPAIRALKKSFGSRITVLTSSMAAGIAALMPEIDEVLVFDMPWVKTERPADNRELAEIIDRLRVGAFDAAVIFTVFSQNPLPSAMLAYQAGIPEVLAYCRENPYGLITNWVPDEEPYTLIRHQVQRDINLVAAVCAKDGDDSLRLNTPLALWPHIQNKLSEFGWKHNNPWMVMHPGVSEPKRRYPVERWIAAGKALTAKGYQLVITGTWGEAELATEICQGIGAQSLNVAGLLGLDELVCLIKHSPLLLSVNTGPVHIAAGVDTPVVVLYAQTNPQHTPWGVPSRVLQFPVPTALQSHNELLRHVQRTVYHVPADMPGTDEIVAAVESLIRQSELSGRPFL